MEKITVDGNAAACHVAYAFSEIAAIYPITPASPMAELADEWASARKTNLFGKVPRIVQLQSEGGAAGALHGALSCGALTTSFTCSQGLLLMLPNLYKIAGELLPAVLHVSARSLATHALSIFGDHQDVMACRQSGFAMLFSADPQEVMDLALVAHLVSLKSEIPFLHVFDGFRTSHEQTKIDSFTYEEMRALLDQQSLARFRARALDPNSPILRGTTQNPDIYFQNREAANAKYRGLSDAVQNCMDEVAKISKRAYRVFDYFGAPDAEYVLVLMGSGTNTAEETAKTLNANGKKTGVVKVRLYRPFDGEKFCAALPKTCKKIAVLDRTKESGALGEPLYLDVCAALHEKQLSHIRVIGGRYGLGGKEFTPSDCYAVFENLFSKTSKHPFTVGIHDDVTHTSLKIPQNFHLLEENCTECIFYGLGSDGTVGANKNTAKLIGEHTQFYPQAYFCYDSRKSGGVTLSHLRFSPTPLKKPYLITRPDFVACHNPSYVNRLNMLANCKENGIFLLNCPWTSLEELNAYLPPSFKQIIAKKQLRFYVIDGTEIANRVGLKGRTSTIMQAAFFYLHPHLLPYEKALKYLEEDIRRKYARKGESVISKNLAALEQTRSAVKQIHYPTEWERATDGAEKRPSPSNAYYQNFMRPILNLQGDGLPASAFNADGSAPTGTSKYEKHGTAFSLPVWIPENCIQCNFCALTCPHACIRPYLVEESAQTPKDFKTIPALGLRGKDYRIQVAVLDCTGCGVCANVCPAKEKALVMRPAYDLEREEESNWEYAQSLPQIQETGIGNFKRNTVKGSQFYPPLFEFSYACAGCGETAYIKILTQLFGENLIIANATGCSSIYGGSAPSCPYTVNGQGKGPAWANSLFEDNAEFGYGMRLAWAFREGQDTQKSVWIIGGDGWAYDIGFGGLDHVLASGENVNILVLDSEVYSNTGGQLSKGTPTGATARFATSGKKTKKKDLGLMAITYGNAYVAQVSLGANRQQFLNALTEAQNYDGPALIIAYSPCIAHGVNLSQSVDEEKRAVDCGYWLLYRFNPALKRESKNPLSLDSPPPTSDFKAFLLGENRFAALKSVNAELAERLFSQAEEESKERRKFYEKLSALFEP